MERGKSPWDSGPTPVVRGGSGAKAPPLAARPKESASRGHNLYQQKKQPNWVQEKEGGESIPSGRLSEEEIRARSHCISSLILSKREIGDIQSACEGWISSTLDMLIFSKALPCWRSLGSEWCSGQRDGRRCRLRSWVLSRCSRGP